MRPGLAIAAIPVRAVSIRVGLVSAIALVGGSEIEIRGETPAIDGSAEPAGESSCLCDRWQERQPAWIWCDDFEFATALDRAYAVEVYDPGATGAGSGWTLLDDIVVSGDGNAKQMGFAVPPAAGEARYYRIKVSGPE